MMKLVFVSNYFNHHQKPLSEALYKMLGDGYKFIETEEMSEERKKLGYGEDIYPSYVVSNKEFKENKNEYIKAINDADVVMIGSAPQHLIEERMKAGKIIFRYSERPLKKNTEKWKYFIRLYTWRKINPQKGFMYILCSSAYTSADYAKFGLYRNKAYKWGYFTEVKKYEDINKLIDSKQPASILWVARFIDVKHPEVAIEVAKRLKDDGYDFKLNMIGNGELENKINDLINSNGLNDYVNMLGVMKPEEVRKHMEKSEIFLFTSDKGEGWGAVLNESMNSACVNVASHAIGSVPFLIEDGNNGLIYKDGDIEDLYKKTKWLLDNPKERKLLAEKAYLTMINEWNAENAAEKFLKLCDSIIKKEHRPFPYKSGVCSKAEILKDDWYGKRGYMVEKNK